jgi:hypothetical protein
LAIICVAAYAGYSLVVPNQIASRTSHDDLKFRVCECLRGEELEKLSLRDDCNARCLPRIRGGKLEGKELAFNRGANSRRELASER